MSFAHIKARSSYSLLLGMLTIEKLVAQVQKHGMQAVGLCDEGNMFGAMEFALACEGAAIKPLFGCSLKVERQGRVTLIAKDEGGWLNLIKLVSRSFLAHPREPHITLDALEGARGLIVGCGGIGGVIGCHLRENQSVPAEANAERLAKLFPDSFYIEISRHGYSLEEEMNRSLVELADAHHLPIVAAQDCYYAEEKQSPSHKVLLAIGDRNGGGDRLDGVHDFKSHKQMEELFTDIPDALANAAIIAERASFLLEKARKRRLPRLEFPNGEQGALDEKARRGLENRLKTAKAVKPVAEYEDRLKYELGIISKVGFAAYFLIVADIVVWAKNEGIPVGPGRGSGAGSLVSWALGITDLDPLKFGLLFERFLNPERLTMPDFDIDFCESRRDEVIDYVKQTYGEKRVAQIVTFAQLKARAVLRDVGRVQGIPFQRMNEICSLVPFDPINPYTIKRALDEVEELRQVAAEEEGKQLIGVAQDLEGLHRHCSTHAAGLVIADSPLEELVPLYADKNTAMATQFDMGGVEAIGLVKFDFLGLKTLTVIAHAMSLIGVERIPEGEDPKTYELLAKADTIGVFQLESPGMRDVLRKLKPDRLEDIVAIISLYRPGPMDNIPSYIDRKQGREEITHLDLSFSTILAETYGIPIYQEQVMQIAQGFSGFSLTKADILRRAMGKKEPKVMRELKRSFIEGAVNRGKKREVAERVFALVEKFAGYGFNKSHAAAYAVISYRTAWLKCHHPAAFLCASMCQELGNTEKLVIFSRDAMARGIEVLPPDINRSEANFSLMDGGEIAYGLAAIRHVGEAAAAKIAAERQKGGFVSFVDFITRLPDFNRRTMESLINAGSFDCLDENRAACLQFAPGAADWLARGRGLFDDDQSPMPKVEELPIKPRLNKEFELLGFYRSHHPFAEVRGFASSAKLLGAANDLKLALLGYIVEVKKRRIDGKPAAFITLSDAFGEYEAAAFGGVYAAAEPYLKKDAEVRVWGRVKRSKTRRRFNLSRLSPWLGAEPPMRQPEAAAGPARSRRGFVVRISAPQTVAQVSDLKPLANALLAMAHGDGVELWLDWGNKSWLMDGFYLLDENGIAALKRSHRQILAIRSLDEATPRG